MQTNYDYLKLTFSPELRLLNISRGLLVIGVWGVWGSRTDNRLNGILTSCVAENVGVEAYKDFKLLDNSRSLELSGGELSSCIWDLLFSFSLILPVN